jgi:general L-amino acid transport system permease protein
MPDKILPTPNQRSVDAAVARATINWPKLSLSGGIGQAAVLATLLFGAAAAVLLVRHGLRMHGIPFTFSFLSQPAGFEISEGVTVESVGAWLRLAPFTAQDTNLQALICGLLNTSIVAAIAIVLSTVLGILIGVARLSSNLIIRQWSFLYVEVIRNTPLLIQLLAWYFAGVLKLPPLSQALGFGGVIASQQGVSLPSLSAAASPTWWFLLAAALLVAISHRARRAHLPLLIGYDGALLIAGFGVALYGSPVLPDFPVASRFSVTGGINISPEMTGLILAISLNSAAYIAEIVRGAIQSVAKGQWEASAALGLRPGQALRVIILPQAVRVVIPSLGNQYVSLTKNTSLGIAIGYPDLFNVYGTVANQSGRALEGILLVMAVYLGISLGISGLVNIYNRRVVSKGAR